MNKTSVRFLKTLGAFATLATIAFGYSNCSIQTPSADGTSLAVTGGWTNTFDPNQDLSLIGMVPTYANTTIADLTSTTVTAHLQMNHGASTIAGSGVLNNCSTCHYNSTYYPGQFHSRLISAN